MEIIKVDFFLDKLVDNPNFTLDYLAEDSPDDEAWIAAQERQMIDERARRIFEGKDKPITKETQSSDKVKPSGLSPIEAKRNRVTVTTKSKFVPPKQGLGGEEFEEVFRETN